MYLDVKNLELTLTSTHYGDKLRIRLSFKACKSSVCPTVSRCGLTTTKPALGPALFASHT
jgi:hypothetical protein